MRRIGRTGGLQRKFLLALLIVGLIPGIVALVATYRSSTASLKQAIGEGFQEIARSTAIRLASAVDTEIDRVVRLALAPLPVQRSVMLADQRTAPLPEAAESVRYLREWARESKHLLRVTLTDRLGRVVASTDPHLTPNQASQTWWQETMQASRGQAFVGTLAFDADANDMVFEVAVPILADAQENPIGAIGLVVRRTLLTEMILPIHIGDSGHGMLLDTQGTPLICPVLPPTAHLTPPALMNRLTTDRPSWLVAEDDGHGGHQAIVGAAPVQFTHQLTAGSLGGGRWFAFIRQAPEETYAPVYSLLLTVGLIGFGLVVGLSALGFVVGARIVKPITALQREAETLRQTLTLPAPSDEPRGHGLPTLAMEFRTGDELEDLAESFIAMRQRLEANLETIKTQQHELIRQEKLASVGQLLAALAHDLRNPLGIIRSSAQVVLDRPQEEAIRQEMVRYIIDEVDKLSQRLHDFLRYARQKPPDLRLCRPDEVMRDALRQWDALGGHGRITVERRFERSLPSIQVDPEQIKEAVVNLLINAGEAMPDGGTLTITTGLVEGGMVELQVADNGGGIAPEHLTRIFEPFFTTKDYGTGLGLTNVKRLVEDNGGTLEITSTLGQGTACRLRFRPAAAQTPA